VLKPHATPAKGRDERPPRREFARWEDVVDAGGAAAVEGVKGAGCGRVDELQRAHEPLERSTSLQLKGLEERGGLVDGQVQLGVEVARNDEGLPRPPELFDERLQGPQEKALGVLRVRVDVDDEHGPAVGPKEDAKRALAAGQVGGFVRLEGVAQASETAAAAASCRAVTCSTIVSSAVAKERRAGVTRRRDAMTSASALREEVAGGASTDARGAVNGPDMTAVAAAGAGFSEAGGAVEVGLGGAGIAGVGAWLVEGDLGGDWRRWRRQGGTSSACSALTVPRA
jgi:hypothetical protein